MPADVPRLVSGYEEGGVTCGHFYQPVLERTKASRVAQAAFGRGVDLVYPIADPDSGRVVVGERLARGVSVETDTTVTPASFRDATRPRAGAAGLQDAIKAGLIRRATKADAQAWAQAAAAARGDHVPAVANQPHARLAAPRVDNAYVVQKAFVFPAGLYGADSATFFVAKGAPLPEGSPGHSRVYDFNTMTCAGVLCGRDDADE